MVVRVLEDHDRVRRDGNEGLHLRGQHDALLVASVAPGHGHLSHVSGSGSGGSGAVLHDDSPRESSSQGRSIRGETRSHFVLLLAEETEF